MNDKTQDIEKGPMIDLLVIMTGKGEAYFSTMTNEELQAEYDRLMG
ncbi:MAG: hypothetical protein ABS938_00105 [Psychrobacillus psychrodurans]